MKLLLPALCISLLFIAFYPGFLTGKILFHADLLFFFPPWSQQFSGLFERPSNWMLFDEVFLFQPWRNYIVESRQNGVLPLWDPAALCGYPFAAIMQNSIFYIPDRLMDSLPFWAFTYLKGFFHLLVAGLGMAWYLKRKGCSAAAVTLGAITFAFSGFMIVWLGHPNLKSAVWLPWIFNGIDLIFSSPLKGILLASGASALSITAGHPETTLHIATVSALYLVLNMLIAPWPLKRKMIGFLSSIGAALIALSIASCAMIPFAEYLFRSAAFASRTDGVPVQPYLDKILIWSHLIPDLFGRTPDNTYWYSQFHSSEINGGFIGCAALILALAGLLHSKHKNMRTIHGAIMIFCVCVIYKIPPVYHLAQWLPFFKMSYNFRLTMPLAFSSIAMAAMTFDEFLEGRRPIIRSVQGLSASFILAAATIPFWIGKIVPASGTMQSSIARSLIAAITPLVILIALSELILRKRANPRLIGFALIALAAGELYFWGANFNAEFPRHVADILPAGVDRLSSDAELQPFRVLPVGFTLPPHTGSRFGMQDIRGGDALTPLVTENYISIVQPSLRDIKNPTIRMLWIRNFNSKLIDALNVKYIVFPHGAVDESVMQNQQYFSKFSNSGMDVFENRNALPRCFLVPDWEFTDLAAIEKKLIDPGFNPLEKAFITKNSNADSIRIPAALPTAHSHSELASNPEILTYDPHHITINVATPEARLLVLSDTWFPGWRCSIDGRLTPILQTNIMMRGVFVSKGNHSVEFFYHPESYLLGLFVSLVGLMAFVMLLCQLKSNHFRIVDDGCRMNR